MLRRVPARLSAYGRTVFRTLSSRQRAFDIVGAAAFLVVLAPVDFVLVLGMGGGLAALVATAILALYAAALALRRWAPALALGLAWLAAIVQMAVLGDLQTGNIAILLVLYAVGRYGSPLVRWLGLASAGVGAVVAALYLFLLLPAARGESLDWIGVGNVLAAIAGSLAVLALPWTLGMLANARWASRQSRARQLLAQHEAERAEYAVVVEQERNRIARDMHDVVAHSLAVVIAQADGARYAALAQPAVAAAALGTIAGTAREALADVRLLLAELRHSEAEGPQPTVHDLERLVGQLRATGLEIEERTSGAARPMSAGHQIAVYRIVQEALTNVLRHGDADSPVLLELAWSAAGVRLRVTSAMAGGGAPPAQSPRGHGIPGMRERAVLAGGSFAAGSTADGRFEVVADIPCGTVAPQPAGPQASAPQPAPDRQHTAARPPGSQHPPAQRAGRPHPGEKP